jgi:hypothetical protein
MGFEKTETVSHFSTDDGSFVPKLAANINYIGLDISLFDIVHHAAVGWNSSVGKAARYGLDGPGIES